jgi:hypothetical protein
VNPQFELEHGNGCWMGFCFCQLDLTRPSWAVVDAVQHNFLVRKTWNSLFWIKRDKEAIMEVPVANGSVSSPFQQSITLLMDQNTLFPFPNFQVPSSQKFWLKMSRPNWKRKEYMYTGYFGEIWDLWVRFGSRIIHLD